MTLSFTSRLGLLWLGSIVTTSISSSILVRESCQNDVKAFVDHLALNGSFPARVAEAVTSQKCSTTSVSTEVDRAKLACYINNVVFGSEYLDASSADYTNRTKVNWYGVPYYFLYIAFGDFVIQLNTMLAV